MHIHKHLLINFSKWNHNTSLPSWQLKSEIEHVVIELTSLALCDNSLLTKEDIARRLCAVAYQQPPTSR